MENQTQNNFEPVQPAQNIPSGPARKENNKIYMAIFIAVAIIAVAAVAYFFWPIDDASNTGAFPSPSVSATPQSLPEEDGDSASQINLQLDEITISNVDDEFKDIDQDLNSL